MRQLSGVQLTKISRLLVTQSRSRLPLGRLACRSERHFSLQLGSIFFGTFATDFGKDCPLRRLSKVYQPVVDDKDNHEQVAERRSLLGLAAMAFMIGAATGCVGAIFRLLLALADHLRDTMITWGHGHAISGFLIVVGTCAVATLVATWMVRRFSPHASGSG